MNTKQSNIDDLYQEIILDHAERPRNKGTLLDATYVITELNASCGDHVKLYVLVEDGIIKDCRWEGGGCAISTASMSMISETIIGKTVVQAKTLTKENLMKEMGIATMLPTREKCLMIGLRALKQVMP